MGLGLNCCCEQCPGFCDDVARAVVLITLSGVAGTRPSADATCPDCDFFNQTYSLTYLADNEPLYGLQCPPYEDMVTNCFYAYSLLCAYSEITIHFVPYTTAGGDRRGYVEVKGDSFGGNWIQSADFLMASGATAIECLEFTLTAEPLTSCLDTTTDPPTDCTAPTAFDLSIEAG
jgi:hypothetical protein